MSAAAAPPPPPPSCITPAPRARAAPQAELHEKPIKQIRNRQWGWYHWSKTLKLTDGMKDQLARNLPVKLELASKALSGDFNVQPETMEPYYNARGVCINHWYRVPVVLDPRVDADMAPELLEFENTPSGACPRRRRCLPVAARDDVHVCCSCRCSCCARRRVGPRACRRF